MDPATLIALVLRCAPDVHPQTVQAIVAVESSFNPHAIGVVGGVLQRQPRSRAEALATAQALQARGWNFSVGLSQINRSNLSRLGLTLSSAFQPCTNLAALQAVLRECYGRALGVSAAPQVAVRDALSCYYSGNFRTGYRDGYVDRVVAAVGLRPAALRHGNPPPHTEAP